MRLIDEEEVEKQKIKTQKTKRMIIITIIIICHDPNRVATSTHTYPPM